MNTKTFTQFKNDVLSRLGINNNSNGPSLGSFKSVGLLSIFSNAARNDIGKDDSLFEYNDEQQYNELLQKGLELFNKPKKEEKDYSIMRTIINIGIGIGNFFKELPDRLKI